MKVTAIKSLLKDTLGPNTQFHMAGEWVMLPCPFAQWEHSGRSDSKPSFGVHIKDNGTSKFHCFTCHKKGPLSYFLQLMEKYTGENYGKLIHSLQNEETYQAELPEWEDCRQLQNDVLNEPLPSYLENLYDRLEEIPQYLKDRGIVDKRVLNKARLCLDPDDKGVERVVFPVYGLDKKLYGFTGRATNDKAIPKVRDYHGLPKGAILLGLHNVLYRSNRIILVEGLMDYLNLLQHGHTALAVMHSGLTDAQAAILKEIALPVFLMYDNDKAGQSGAAEASKKLKGYVPVMVCDWDVSAICGDMPLPNDPAELTKKEIKYMLDQAAF